jgi:hypothetical protein
MSTEIAKKEPNFFEAYGNAVATRNIVGDLLRLTKFGEYNAGIEGEEIPLGTRLIVAMPTLMAGHVKWEENRPVDQRMGYVAEGFVPLKRKELGDNDTSLWERDEETGKERDPWQFTNTLVMVRPADNALFTFTTSSKGGLNAIGELSKTYGKHIRMAPDDLPGVELRMGRYQHRNRNYGKIAFPIFKLFGWVPGEPIMKLIGDNDEGDSVPNTSLEMLKPPAASDEKKPAAAAAKATAPAKKST